MKKLAALVLALSSCDSKEHISHEPSDVKKNVIPALTASEFKCVSKEIFHESQMGKSGHTIYIIPNGHNLECNLPAYEALDVLLDAHKVDAFVTENLYQDEIPYSAEFYQSTDHGLMADYGLIAKMRDQNTPIYGTQNKEQYENAVKIMEYVEMYNVIETFNSTDSLIRISTMNAPNKHREFRAEFKPHLVNYATQIKEAGIANKKLLNSKYASEVHLTREEQVLTVVSQLTHKGIENIVIRFGADHLSSLKSMCEDKGHTVLYTKKIPTTNDPYIDVHQTSTVPKSVQDIVNVKRRIRSWYADQDNLIKSD